MAANERFILEFVTKNIENLDRAKDKIDQINARVNTLATSLLGVGFATFAANALMAADQLVDFSNATNISIASLKAMQEAMDVAGGSGKNLEKSINTLFQSIDAANQGSQNARDAFAKVGVSMADLRDLSEADILQKTLEGLAKLPVGAERSAIAAQLLSRSMRNVDPQQLLDALDPAKYEESAEAARLASERIGQLEDAYRNLQEGALRALEPILKMFGEQNISVDAATKMIQALGIALGVSFGAAALANILNVVSAVAKLTIALKGTVAVQAALQALQGPKGWAILAGSAAAAAAAVYGLNKLLDETSSSGSAAADSLSQLPAPPGAGAGGRIQPAIPSQGPANRAQELGARERAILESEKRIAQSRAEIAKLGALKEATDVGRIQIERDAEIAKARTEIMAKEHLNQNQKDAEFAAKRQEIEKKADLEIFRFRSSQQQELLRQRQAYQDQIGQLLGYEKSELQKINEQIALQPEKYSEVADQLRQQAELHDRNLRFVKEYNKEQERQRTIFRESIQQGVDYASRQAELVSEQKRQLDLLAASSEQEKLAINERFAMEQRMSQFVKSQVNDKLAAAMASDLEGDATAEQIQLITDYLEKVKLQRQLEESILSIRLQQAEQLREIQESFSYGWEDAYKKYAEDAKNSADQARTYFSTFTRGFEDAFVRFVQTGKLSFKDLINSMIADFARIEAKKMFLQLFGGPTGGGLLGNFFGFFGKAGGGPVMSQRPYMVGESGPELFVPNTAGKIFPNYSLAGQPSPAAVTYNINAVDAASFRALVARDPSFIYAVTEQGRRSQPTRSR